MNSKGHLFKWLRVLVIALGLALIHTGSGISKNALAADPSTNNLVVFIADQFPLLCRLVNDQVIPFSNSRFYSPASIIVDPNRRCFYVLDQPPPGDSKLYRLFSIDTNGHAKIIARFQLHGMTQSLFLDQNGHLFVCDSSDGLLRLQPPGTLIQIIKPQGKLKYITAAAERQNSLIVATKYVKKVGQTSTGLTYTQGGQGALYRTAPNFNPTSIQKILDNVWPGQPEHQTCWRSISQMIASPSGQIIMADAGSLWEYRQDIYTLPLNSTYRTSHPPYRNIKSEINGGLLALDPSGTLRQFAQGGPIRSPQGLAQWSRDTVIVADPKMYQRNIGTSGGLYLVSSNGAIGKTWHFSPDIRPIGVAILYGQTHAVIDPVNLTNLQGQHPGSDISNGIQSVSWIKTEQQGMRVAGQFIATSKKKVPQTKYAASMELNRIFGHGTWTITPAGSIFFNPPGKDIFSDQPDVMSGSAKMIHHVIVFNAKSTPRTKTDPNRSVISGTIQYAGNGRGWLHALARIESDNGSLQGEFDQMINMPSIPLSNPKANDPSKITGNYTGASMDRILFAQWTQWVIAGSPSSPSYGLFREKQRFPQQQAISQVQRLFGQSTWQINSNGAVQIVCPAGTFSGTLDNLYHEIPFKASAINGAHQQAKISGRIERIDNNRIIAYLNIALSKGNQDITAEFEQKLRIIR